MERTLRFAVAGGKLHLRKAKIANEGLNKGKVKQQTGPEKWSESGYPIILQGRTGKKGNERDLGANSEEKV